MQAEMGNADEEVARRAPRDGRCSAISTSRQNAGRRERRHNTRKR